MSSMLAPDDKTFTTVRLPLLIRSPSTYSVIEVPKIKCPRGTAGGLAGYLVLIAMHEVVNVILIGCAAFYDINTDGFLFIIKIT